MARLEELTVGTSVRGIRPDAAVTAVTVHATNALGDSAVLGTQRQ